MQHQEREFLQQQQKVTDKRYRDMSMDELSTMVEKEEEKTKSAEESFQAEVDMMLGSGRRDPIAPREEVGLEGHCVGHRALQAAK